MSRVQARQNPLWLLVLAGGLLAVCAGGAEAQGRLLGTVKDSAGRAIPGAEISLQDIRQTATSGRNGEFSLAGLRPGVVELTVRRLGYAPFTSPVRIEAGDNELPPIVLTAVPTALDTMAIRDQQLLRENPLLAEMEENRKVGLGQFVTREQLDRLQGGFVSLAFNSMRGLVVIRDNRSSATWLATKYIPGPCDMTLEGLVGGPLPNPCQERLCFPEVYLDYTKLSSRGSVPNIAQFSPDQLQGIQVFQGPAETPPRYSASTGTSCGVVVFHSRPFEKKATQRIAGVDGPVRSPVFINASFSAGRGGAKGCVECGVGPSIDGMLGYTLRDRWVVAGRYAKWSGREEVEQSITFKQLVLEWYPHEELAKTKWMIQAGVGLTDAAVTAREFLTGEMIQSAYKGSSMPSMMIGTGVDVSVYRRLVLTPFFSYTRTLSGTADWTRCTYRGAPGTIPTATCNSVADQPVTFTMMQLGTRVGWR